MVKGFFVGPLSTVDQQGQMHRLAPYHLRSELEFISAGLNGIREDCGKSKGF